MTTQEMQAIAEKEFPIEIMKGFGGGIDRNYNLRQAFLAGLQHPTRQVKEDWVSVEEELPQSDRSVICWRESEFHPELYYEEIGNYGFFKKGIWGALEKDNWAVTHWMPLPNPPANQTLTEK